MKVTILGCGTSFGVPMIACTCPVCASGDPKNVRSRSSILVTHEGRNVLVDTTTDLRAQAIANSIDHVDAVLYTHPHAEHIHGIDEMRRFNWLQGTSIPCYGNADTLARIRRTFEYIFTNPGLPGWQPNLTTHEVDGPFDLFGMRVVPVEVMHGSLPILGYRFGAFAYVTDFSVIPEKSYDLLAGLDVMVLEALRYEPHPAHVTLEEALAVVERLRPKRAIFTHMAHQFDYKAVMAGLPSGVELAYDGMVIEV
ncbi:MAG: MBL fold metallo-hydrolase [Nitrospirae bacterium]|nr:MBL fold metallo-hydrolase [Nitrospirota bacterium]